MEANAVGAGLLKNIIKPVVKSAHDIAEPILKHLDNFDITTKVKETKIPKQNAGDIMQIVKEFSKNSQENSDVEKLEEDIIIYHQYYNEEYKYTINSPFFWTPYDGKNIMLTAEELTDPDIVDWYKEVTLFSDDISDLENATGFFLTVFPYFDIYEEVDGLSFLEHWNQVTGEMCDGVTADVRGYVCKNVQVLESVLPATEVPGRTSSTTTHEVLLPNSGVIETMYAKTTIVQGDSFVYILSFGDTKDRFETFSVVYDEIEKSFSVNSSGGGCLIATAAFGSEMAPQVQFLRELRDNTVLQTQSGTNFMTGFNQFYYSFSPAVADLERENPVFKETVKLTLTPLLTSLTLLNYVDIDTESEMLGYGIGVILLNIGMYFIAPAVLIKRIFLQSK